MDAYEHSPQGAAALSPQQRSELLESLPNFCAHSGLYRYMVQRHIPIGADDTLIERESLKCRHLERLTLVAPAPFTPTVYTIAEVLALWPEGARPTDARQLGACRICGRSMTGTGGRETPTVPSATAIHPPVKGAIGTPRGTVLTS